MKVQRDAHYEPLDPRRTNPTRDSDPYEQEQLQQAESAIAASRLREETLYVIDLITVLQPHAAGRRRWAVMQSIRGHRKKTGAPIPQNFEHAVESAFQQYCADSGVFNKGKGPAKPALFHWPLGKAGGVWAVYPEAAEAWMRVIADSAVNAYEPSRR